MGVYTDSIDNTSPAESCHDSCSSSAPSTPKVMSKLEFGKENMLLATPPINSKRKIDLHGDSIKNGSLVDDSPSTKRKRDGARPVTRQSRRLLNKSNSQDRDHESKERKNSIEVQEWFDAKDPSLVCDQKLGKENISSKSNEAQSTNGSVSDNDAANAIDHEIELNGSGENVPGSVQKLGNENISSKSNELQSTNGRVSDNDAANAVVHEIELNGSGENDPGSVQRFCNKAKNSCRIM